VCLRNLVVDAFLNCKPVWRFERRGDYIFLMRGFRGPDYSTSNRILDC